MADCCFDRSKMEKKRAEEKDKKEVDTLFIDNTKMASIDRQDESLPYSGLSKSTAQRLKIEFRFIRHVARLLSQNEFPEANDLVKEYYNNQICKTKSSEECGNIDWCSKCSSIKMLTTDHLKYLDDVLTDNFKHI